MDKDLVLTRAKNAEMSHDFVTAVRAYKELLKDNPKNIDYLSSIASIYVKAGEDEKAIPFYEEIITYYPHYVQAMNSLGAIFRRLKRYDESIAILQKALDEGRDSAMVNYNLGFTYKEMKMYADAIDCFEVTVSLNPDDVLAYNHMGSIYLEQRDYQKAIISYKRGLQIDQNHPILNYNLARCYEQTEMITEAIRCYESALKTKPGWVEAIHSFSELLLKSNKTKDAQSIVQRSISLYPNDEKLLCMLGNIFLTQFDYDAAEKTFKRAENANGKNIEALSGLAEALEKNEKVQEALDVLEKALKIDPDNRKLQKQEVSSLLSANEYEEAYDKIQNLYKQTGESDPQVLDLYGQYYVCTKDDESAKFYFNKIKSVDRHYKDYLISASRRYSQTGNVESAEKAAQEYITRRGNDPIGYNALGNVYASAGELDKALATFDQGSSFPQTNIFAAKQTEKLKKKIADIENKKDSVIVQAVEENQPEQKEEVQLNPEEIIEKAEEKGFDFASMGDRGSGFKQMPISPEESLWDDFSDEFEDTEEQKEIKAKEEAAKPVYEPQFVQPENQLISDDSELVPDAESAPFGFDDSEEENEIEKDGVDDEVVGMEELSDSEEIIDLEPDGFAEPEKASSDDFDFSQFEETTASEPEDIIPETDVEKSETVPEFEPLQEAQTVIQPEPVKMEPPQMPPSPMPSYNMDYAREMERQMQATSAANTSQYAMEIAMVSQQMAQKLADGQTKLALAQKELEEKVKETQQMQEELVMHQLRAEQLEQELMEQKAINLERQKEELQQADFQNEDSLDEDSLSVQDDIEENGQVEELEKIDLLGTEENSTDAAALDDVEDIEEIDEIEEIEDIEEVDSLEETEEVAETDVEEKVSEEESENSVQNVTSEQMFFLVNDNISPDMEDYATEDSTFPDSQDLINQLMEEEKSMHEDFEFATVESILADLMILENSKNENPVAVTETTQDMFTDDAFATVEEFADAEEPVVEEDDFATVEEFAGTEEPAVAEEDDFATVEEVAGAEEPVAEEDDFATVEEFADAEEPVVEEDDFATVEEVAGAEEPDAAEEDDFATVEEFADAEEPVVEEDDFATVEDVAGEEEPVVEEDDFATVEEFAGAEESVAEEDDFATVEEFAGAEEPDAQNLSKEQMLYLIDDNVMPDEKEFGVSEKHVSDDAVDVVADTQEYLISTLNKPEEKETAFASVDDFIEDETPSETAENNLEEEDFFATVDELTPRTDGFPQLGAESPLSTDQMLYLVDDNIQPDIEVFEENKSQESEEDNDVEILEAKDYLYETISAVPQPSIEPVPETEDALTADNSVTAENETVEEDSFASVDEIVPEGVTKEKMEMQALLQKIENMLQDKTIASEYGAELEMFKKLKLLMEFLPAEAVSGFNIEKLKVQIEYIIARISGKPGLCMTITSLIKSGALGEEYASRFAARTEDELEDCSVEVIMNVIQNMKKLTENLPDNQLAKALCDSADEVIRKIME